MKLAPAMYLRFIYLFLCLYNSWKATAQSELTVQFILRSLITNHQRHHIYATHV